MRYKRSVDLTTDRIAGFVPGLQRRPQLQAAAVHASANALQLAHFVPSIA